MRLYSGAVYSCTVPVLDNVLLYSSWEGGRMIRSCRKSRRERPPFYWSLPDFLFSILKQKIKHLFFYLILFVGNDGRSVT